MTYNRPVCLQESVARSLRQAQQQLDEAQVQVHACITAAKAQARLYSQI